MTKSEQMQIFLEGLNIPSESIGEAHDLKKLLSRGKVKYLSDYLGIPSSPLLAVPTLFIITTGKGRLETFRGYRIAYIDYEKRFPRKYVLGKSVEGHRSGDIIRFDIFSAKTAILI